MAAEIKKLQKSQIEITGEIPTADFDRAVLRSLREWNEKANLPGFRPGKIPENILIEKVGMDSVLERAAEIALGEHYPKILDEQKIDAVGRPQITITKMARGNALGFKAVTAVVPDVSLPDNYKTVAQGIASKKEALAVEEKEVADALEYLRSMNAVKSEKGEEQKPELNDEFAKKIGQSSVDALKKMLTDNIRADKERKAKDKKRMEILGAVAALAAIDIPDALVEGEREKMLAELKNSLAEMGLSWDDYLKHIKKTEADIVQEWRPEAEKRVRFGLVMREIAEEEHLEPTEAEVTAHAEDMAKRYPAAERGAIDKVRLAGYAYGMLRNEKVFELLEKSA